MKYLLFLLTIASLPVFGQNSAPAGLDNMRTGPVYTVVQQAPKFKGDMNKYLVDNIKYPAIERKTNVTGTVYISFVVNKDGSVSDAKVLKGVEKGPGLDAEALRVVSAMPAWTPGMNDGKLVRVQYNLPINFQLR